MSEINEIVHLAWADKVSFEIIKNQTGMSEKNVIKLMRDYLKPKSFKVWRMRVSGRRTKHLKLFEFDQGRSTTDE